MTNLSIQPKFLLHVEKSVKNEFKIFDNSPTSLPYIEKFAESKYGFNIIQRKGQKAKTLEPCKEIIKLLKKDYPMVAKENPKINDFLEALLSKFKNEIPTKLTFKNFAARVIDKITENPQIEKEINNLSDAIYY